MGSPALFGKLANFQASLRKPGLVAFGLFNAQDNLAFIADFPAAGRTLSQATELYSAALAIDTSAADVISVTLTGNATLSFNYGGSVTIPNGVKLWIRLVQDATGGRTVAFPVNMLIDQGVAVDPGPLRATVLALQYDAALSKWKFFETMFSVPTA